MNSSVADANRSPLNSINILCKKRRIYSKITEITGNLDQTSSGYSQKKYPQKSYCEGYSLSECVKYNLKLVQMICHNTESILQKFSMIFCIRIIIMTSSRVKF